MSTFKQFIIESTVSDHLAESIKQLELSVSSLMSEGERYYAAKDNMRGNIRHDAAKTLETILENLKIKQSYIIKALQK